MSDYPVIHAEVGYLERQTVKAVVVPRSEWLELVEQALALYSDNVVDKERLRETARTMPHFPFGKWMAPDRGCGCLVGEYLVAADVITRECADTLVVDRIEMRFEHDEALALEGIGLDVDHLLKAHVSWDAVEAPAIALFD